MTKMAVHMISTLHGCVYIDMDEMNVVVRMCFAGNCLSCVFLEFMQMCKLTPCFEILFMMGQRPGKT